MEPVSFVASIFTLIEATGAAGEGLRRIWALRDAPTNLISIQNEVTDFRAALVFVQDALEKLQKEDSSADISHIEAAIKRGAKIVDGLNTLIETRLSCSDGIRRRGFLKRKRLEKLISSLKDAKADLMAALGAVNYLQIQQQTMRLSLAIQSISLVDPSIVPASSAAEAQRSEGTIITNNKTSKQDKDASNDRNLQELCQEAVPSTVYLDNSTEDSQNLVKPVVDHQSLSSLQDTPTSQGRVPRLEKLSQNPDNESKGALVSDRVDQEHQNPPHELLAEMLIANSNSNAPRSLVRVTATAASTNCPPFCGCQCHTSHQNRSPRWLRGLIGTIFYKYTGNPLLGQKCCNYVRCRNNRSIARFQYHFPAWMFPLVINATGSWNDLGASWSWSLQIPQYLPGALWDIFELIYDNQDPLELEKFMDKHKICGQSIHPISDQSLLQYVLYVGSIEYVEVLIRRGADWHFQSGGQRPFLTAAEEAWKYILGTGGESGIKSFLLKMLDEHDVSNTSGFNVIHDIVTGLLDLDLQQQVDLHPELINATDSFGRTPLHWAVERSDIWATSLLIESGADVKTTDFYGRTALHYTDSKKCAKALIDAGADLNVEDTDGCTPITRSIYQLSQIPLYLLENGADPSLGSRLAIIEAARCDNADIIHTLLDKGMGIDQFNDFGESAVVIAVTCNQLNSLRCLIERGARLDMVDLKGRSIMNYVAAFGNIFVIDTLTKANIKGLRMSKEHIEFCWEVFENQRPTIYIPQRAPIEEERKAFQMLIESVCSWNEAVEDPEWETESMSSDEFVDAEEEI